MGKEQSNDRPTSLLVEAWEKMLKECYNLKGGLVTRFSGKGECKP